MECLGRSVVTNINISGEENEVPSRNEVWEEKHLQKRLDKESRRAVSDSLGERWARRTQTETEPNQENIVRVVVSPATR